MRVHELQDKLEIPLLPLILSPGEDSKDFSNVLPWLEKMADEGVHRSDLLVCLGGGVCCDFGGLLAMLYMRGISYACVPTSLMAMIDGSIGGKVGANLGIRKNLFGGFYHSEIVFIDTIFLNTVPALHLHSALAEVVKIGIILGEIDGYELLCQWARDFSFGNNSILEHTINFSIQQKLKMLKPDPYEYDLNRELNLGHSVAHALERLKVKDGDRFLTHGEAVALGLATKARYSVKKNLCDQQRAEDIISALVTLGLPTKLERAPITKIKRQLSQISDHRGGVYRIVLPTGKKGVSIFENADVDCLADCTMHD